MTVNELSILPGEIHLHYADLREYCVERPETLLSPDEIDRAERYRFEKDFLWFVRERGFLREVLSGYKRCPPGEIYFHYEKNGKPILKGEPFVGLHFNMAHSADMVAVVVSIGRRVGIDIEKIRYDIPYSDLADRFFSDTEADGVKNIPGRQKAEYFLKIWTRKEALLKATGEGIEGLGNCFDLSNQCHISRNGTSWQVHDLLVPSGYVSAFAIEGTEGFIKIEHYRALTGSTVL